MNEELRHAIDDFCENEKSNFQILHNVNDFRRIFWVAYYAWKSDEYELVEPEFIRQFASIEIADKAQIIRIFMNEIQNAMKHLQFLNEKHLI